MTKIVFIDTETTGLSDRAEIWEIGAIVRTPGEGDVEYAWQIRPTLVDAEPTGLRIGRYYERIHDDLNGASPGTARRIVHPRGVPGDGLSRARTSAGEIAAELAPILDGAYVVGAVPWFDERHLQPFLRRHFQCATNRYHLIDVETLAAGQLGIAPPWNFDVLLERFDLKYDEADRHTALGDARMARDLYDAVNGREGTGGNGWDPSSPQWAVIRAATAWRVSRGAFIADDPERRGTPEDLALIEAVDALPHIGEATDV